MLNGTAQPGPTGPMTSRDCNYLVASDLHLTLVLDDEDRATDREVVAFLDNYRSRPAGSRPWCLILAGDVIDLLYPDMELFLKRYPEASAPRAKGNASYFEHWDVKALAWRLKKVMEERSELFLALARFLLAGNSLVMIKGNHDVEFQWSVLQEAFVDTLTRIAREAGESLEGAALAKQIEFSEWFFCEPGRIYVEHGNQYDEFNCSPNFLDPALVHDPNRAFAPLGSRMTQYLTNAFVEYKPGSSQGTFMNYIKRTKQMGSRKFISRSLKIIGHALSHAGAVSEEGWRTSGGKEDSRLKLMEKKTGIPREKLRELQGLQATPATAIRGFFFNRMFLDRLFILFFGIAVLITALLLGLLNPGEPALLAALAASPLATAVAIIYRFKRKHWNKALRWVVPATLVSSCIFVPLALGQGTMAGTFLVAFTCLVVSVSMAIIPLPEMLDLSTYLIDRATRIRDLLGVQVVVFGHTHRPAVHKLEGGGLYMNSGGWVNTGMEGNHAHAVLVRCEDGSFISSLHRGRDYLGES